MHTENVCADAPTAWITGLLASGALPGSSCPAESARALELQAGALQAWRVPPPHRPGCWPRKRECGSGDRCWADCEGRGDEALVCGVGQGPALDVLQRDSLQRGVSAARVPIDRLDAPALVALDQRGGGRTQRGAQGLPRPRSGRAAAHDTVRVLAQRALPAADNWVVFDFEGLRPHPDTRDTAYPKGIDRRTPTACVRREHGASRRRLAARSAVDGCRPATSIDGGGATSSACLLGFEAIIFVDEVIFFGEIVFLDGIAFLGEVRRERRAFTVRRPVVPDANTMHRIRRVLVVVVRRVRVRDNKVQIRRRRTVTRIDAVKHDAIDVAPAEIVKDERIARWQPDLKPVAFAAGFNHVCLLPQRIIAFLDEIRRERRATDVRRTMVSDSNAMHRVR